MLATRLSAQEWGLCSRTVQTAQAASGFSPAFTKSCLNLIYTPHLVSPKLLLSPIPLQMDMHFRRGNVSIRVSLHKCSSQHLSQQARR